MVAEEIDFAARIEDFLNSFKTVEGETPYRDAIERLETSDKRSVVVQFDHIASHDPELAKAIRENPDQAIEAASTAIHRIARVVIPDYARSVETFHIRFREVPDDVSVRDIRSEHIGNLIKVDAMVTRVSDVKPLLVEGVFKCRQCGNVMVIPQAGQYTPPPFCSEKACGSRRGPFDLLAEKSKFTDWQKIRLQEKPEELPPGTLPRALDCFLLDDLVDLARPGDPVRIVGVLKSSQDISAVRRKAAPTFSVFLMTNSVDVLEREADRLEITPKEKEEIIKLSQDPLIHRKIINSVAPSIYGLTDIKEAVILLLFGGVGKELSDGVKIRGDSNILLVGDPGTAKSIDGSELIYIGQSTDNGIKWTREKIGPFIDTLMESNVERTVLQGDTEILPLDGESNLYTQAMDPLTLKVQRARIFEVSRHKTKHLVRIQTRSGRSVLATPDHSFTTIEGGQLKVTKIQDLRLGVYLPIARNLRFNEEQAALDLTEDFLQTDMVSTETIRSQIALVNAGLTSARSAASAANVTPNTIGDIIHGRVIIPSGSWLRRKRDTSWFPRWLPLNSSLARIIGIYLAEGNVHNNDICISSTDNSIKSVVEEDLIAVFGKASVYKRRILYCQSSIAQWFEQNFGTGAANKRLPDLFLAASLSFRCNLLSAYFSGDGTVDERGAAVTAITKSEQLAYQISDLLSTLNIYTTIKRREVTKGLYKGRVYYQLRIQGVDVLQYHKHIGFVSSEKQKELDQLVRRLISRTRYQSRDIIPNFGTLLKQAVRELGLRSSRGSWTRSFIGELRGKTYRQRMGRKYLQKVVTKLRHCQTRNRQSPSLKRLEALAYSDIFWDPIIKIEHVNDETTVYDIATSDGHFLLAQGNLIVHNSQLLKYIAALAPRGLYTSGKGSTAAGLTAAVLRDPDTEGLTLEAGALVLADRGLAAIDEFDKMRPQDRTAIHEAMEQHTISIAKAGIVATLNARTAILAAANPLLGRYVAERPFNENVNLPVPLLSRFDLIFTLTDQPESERDERMALHIIELHRRRDIPREPPISMDLLRKYIAHARREIKPLLTEEALKVLKDFYLQMRKMGERENAPVPITARQLESLIRLAEAHAKMALREKVLADDAQSAIRLVHISLRQVGVDPETGQFDIDSIVVGRPKSQSDKIQSILKMIRELQEEIGGAVPLEKLEQRAELEGITREFLQRAIIQLRDKEGLIFEPRPGMLKYIKSS